MQNCTEEDVAAAPANLNQSYRVAGSTIDLHCCLTGKRVGWRVVWNTLETGYIWEDEPYENDAIVEYKRNLPNEVQKRVTAFHSRTFFFRRPCSCFIG